MVLKATPLQQKEWDALPSRREMGKRRIASFIVYYIVLCAIFLPFRPFTWISISLHQNINLVIPSIQSFFHSSPPLEYVSTSAVSTKRLIPPPPPPPPRPTTPFYTPRATALDNFFTPLYIFGGMYLHYTISTIISPNPLYIPILGVRIGTWKYSWYWKFVAAELAVALIVMGMRMKAEVVAGSWPEVREDFWGRKAVAGLWMVGLWGCAPEEVRVWGFGGFGGGWWVYLAWGEVRVDGRRVSRGV